MSAPAALTADERRQLLERVIARGVDGVAESCGMHAQTVANAIVGRRLSTMAAHALRGVIGGAS